MKSFADVSLVNGSQGDPAVHLFFPTTGDAILFDLGMLENLQHKDLLRVRHAFVSHAHVDHFIGFDRLLRVNVPHRRQIELCGPEGFSKNVQGKLRGYLWNLVEPGQIRMAVTEVAESGDATRFTLRNDDGFDIHEASRTTGVEGVARVAELADGSVVMATVVDHGTASVAYACRAAKRYNVDPQMVSSLGLQPGPWIKDLQAALARGDTGAIIDAGGQMFQSDELGRQIMTEQSPQGIGYVTDLVFGQRNLERLKRLLRGCSVIVCETSFHDRDRQRALDKKHLTSRHAALIAAFCGCTELKTFHISNVYGQEFQAVDAEAQEFFRRFSAQEKDQLQSSVADELRQC